jgi:hypothetical protein
VRHLPPRVNPPGAAPALALGAAREHRAAAMTATTTFARLARLAFWGALAFALVMAWMPHAPNVGEVGDKAQHMLAFGTLSALAAAAYPATPLTRIGERLLFVGAMVELVQSVPALHRDCELADWFADAALVVGVLTVVAIARTRLEARPAAR